MAVCPAERNVRGAGILTMQGSVGLVVGDGVSVRVIEAFARCEGVRAVPFNLHNIVQVVQFFLIALTGKSLVTVHGNG